MRRFHLLLVIFFWLIACDGDFSDAAVRGSSTNQAGATAIAGSSGSSSSSSSSTNEAGATATGGSSTSEAGTATTGGAAKSIARVISQGSIGPSSGTSIHTTIEFANVSQSDFALAEFRLRYWFTAELATGATLITDVGSGLFSQRVSIGTVVPPRAGADHYIEIAFASGTILAGETTRLSFECHQANWAAFDQADDYSYPADVIDGAELITVGVYHNDILVAGIEPV